MTAHVSDEIAGMLRGDTRPQTARTAAAHLRVCDDCRDDLIGALTAHAALTSAARLLNETESEAVPGSALGPEFSITAIRAPIGLPPLLTPTSPTGRRIRSAHGIAAAIAAIAAAAAVVAVVAVSDGSSSRSATLSAYGAGTSNAAATLIGADELDLETNLPALDRGSHYEVWLTDTGRTVMTPVGTLDESGQTDLSLSPATLAQYADIEVSVQSPTDGAGYSGVSVLRGRYRRT